MVCGLYSQAVHGSYSSAAAAPSAAAAVGLLSSPCRALCFASMAQETNRRASAASDFDHARCSRNRRKQHLSEPPEGSPPCKAPKFTSAESNKHLWIAVAPGGQ